MMKYHIVIALFISLIVTGCESVKYIKDEISGNAKPAGGIQELISPTKNYKTSFQALRKATLTVLDEQGYIYEENPSTNTIKTEPKLLTDPSKVMFVGSSYSVKLFIKVEGTSITYRAKFDKKSSLTTGEQNIEYPEKENELRRVFFAELDKKLTN